MALISVSVSEREYKLKNKRKNLDTLEINGTFIF